MADSKNRKKRIDSTGEHIRIIQSSYKDLSPPDHVKLSEPEMPFFKSVVAEFARADWTQHQLEIAAMLSRAMCSLEAEQRQLAAEGYITERANGTTVENPRARAVQTLAGQVLSFRRSLSLHARGMTGDNRKIADRRKQAKGLESQMLGQPLGLIAPPPMSN